MITFEGGRIGLRTFHHENCPPVVGRQRHRANLQPDLLQGRNGHLSASTCSSRTTHRPPLAVPPPPAGRAAFEASLVNQFNTNYASNRLWTGAPSDPNAGHAVLPAASPHTRPGTSVP